MKKYLSVFLITSLALLMHGCASQNSGAAASQQVASAPPPPITAPNGAPLQYRTEEANAPIVYFTKDVSPQGMLKVYKALNQQLVGKALLKVSFGGATEQYLDPQLLSEVAKATNATFGDTCGFTPPRDNPQGNRQMAERHGFAAVAPVDILDEDGDMDIPVNGGYHLQYARVGSHVANYDTFIAVHRFKDHYIPVYGGTLKNISLNLASLSGHAIIHSAGENERYYERRDKKTTAESFADAAKAAVNYKKGRWVFINVLDAFAPEDNCAGTKNLGDIGIIASADPVAVDQAAVDFRYGAAPSAAIRSAWETAHSVEMLEHAEKIGVGQRHYRLVSVD